MSDFAPVVIFAYRCAGHLRKMQESLVHCEGFCAEPHNRLWGWSPECRRDSRRGRSSIDSGGAFLGDRTEYHFSEVNQGLARSVIAGVSEAGGRFGRVIVVEDDPE